MAVSSTRECSFMCMQMSGKLHKASKYNKAVCYALTHLSSANVVRSACRDRSQRSRTQQLQCATVSQHSMYSYIVESGRERCDQRPQAFLRLSGGTHKAHRVSQGRRMTVPVLLCHQKPVLARLWGGTSSCGLSIETLDRFVLRTFSV